MLPLAESLLVAAALGLTYGYWRDRANLWSMKVTEWSAAATALVATLAWCAAQSCAVEGLAYRVLDRMTEAAFTAFTAAAVCVTLGEAIKHGTSLAGRKVYVADSVVVEGDGE